MKNYTFVIADIHGRHDLLVEALAAVDNYQCDGKKLIVTGDMVDRGPDSAKVLATLRSLDNAVILRGNHEDIMLTALREPHHLNWWFGNGGGQTLISYGYVEGDSLKPYPDQLVRDMAWLDGLPYYHEDEYRVYVHADLDESLDLKDQNPNHITWQRVPKYCNDGYRGKHVVHGHMQYEDGPILCQNRTNLDAFAWYTGTLAVGVFDDTRPGGPVDIIRVVCT